MANGHGRAMLAPTRVFRQSDRVNLSFNSCCCSISRFPKAFSYQMLSAKVISIIFVCVLSSWLVVQFLLLFSVCIYLSLIIFVFSLQQKGGCCTRKKSKCSSLFTVKCLQKHKNARHRPPNFQKADNSNRPF